MPTYFYFASAISTVANRPATGVPLLQNTTITGSPLFPTGTGSADPWNKAFPTTIVSSILEITISVPLPANTYEFWGRYCSEPLATQTIPSQVWRYQPFCGEGAAASATFHYPYLVIFRPSTQQVIHTLLDGTVRYAEWYATANGNVDNQTTIPAFDVVNGDLLIAEFWSGQTATISMGPNTHRVGLDFNDGSRSSWVQATTSNITFYTPPAGPGHRIVTIT